MGHCVRLSVDIYLFNYLSNCSFLCRLICLIIYLSGLVVYSRIYLSYFIHSCLFFERGEVILSRSDSVRDFLG